jgi:uncharacterized protein
MNDESDHERRQPRMTWVFAVVFLTFVFGIIGDAFADTLSPFLGLPYDHPERWPVLLYILLASFGASIVLTLLWIELFERRSARSVGFGRFNLRLFLRGYGLGLLMAAAVVSIIWIAGGYRMALPGSEATKAMTSASIVPIGLLLFGFVIQSLSEELAYRGWLNESLVRRFGTGLGLAIGAVVFALTHAFNTAPSPELAAGVFNLFLFGLFLGVYTQNEGSLWGVCGWHAAWNWLTGLGFGLGVSGLSIEVVPVVADLEVVDVAPWWISGATFGPEASVVSSIAFLIAIGTTLWTRANAGTKHLVPPRIAH